MLPCKEPWSVMDLSPAGIAQLAVEENPSMIVPLSFTRFYKPALLNFAQRGYINDVKYIPRHPQAKGGFRGFDLISGGLMQGSQQGAMIRPRDLIRHASYRPPHTLWRSGWLGHGWHWTGSQHVLGALSTGQPRGEGIWLWSQNKEGHKAMIWNCSQATCSIIEQIRTVIVYYQ